MMKATILHNRLSKLARVIMHGTFCIRCDTKESQYKVLTLYTLTVLKLEQDYLARSLIHRRVEGALVSR